MRLGIMQPYFMPYMGYWQLLNAVDKYVIYDDVNYRKRGWINRNQILVNGESKMINLQISKASQNSLINQVQVVGDLVYNHKLLGMIEHSYKKAPQYTKVYPIIEGIVTQKTWNLEEYLTYSIRRICEYLYIDTDILISSSIKKNNDLRGQDKIIEICKVLGADAYINPVGGQELYSQKEFAEQGIQLKFLQTGAVAYPQFNHEFVPNLSIVDVMMFNTVEEIKVLLDVYELI